MAVTKVAALSVILFAAQLGSKSGEPPAKNLSYADVLRVIGCLQQPYSPVNVRPDDSSPTSFRVRYALSVEKVSIHNGVIEKPEILLVIYSRDSKTAGLYEVWPPPI